MMLHHFIHSEMPHFLLKQAELMKQQEPRSQENINISETV